jgi:cell fate regulator YaaT (PSP1 superfamily)
MEPNRYGNFDVVEIKFKNTRKEFFRNIHKLDIHPGEPVVVQSASGYDIGIVSMQGELVKRRMRIKKMSENTKDLPQILRKPNQAEMEKWQETLKQERPTMLKSRHIATELKLSMKISDVEYQADGGKATFYYTAEERVDFRLLIRQLADQFRVRIEMRQIGSRQEAGRLGGIGSCGRELCCSTWLTDFRSVSTNAARYQQLSINPQKLAGQCGKLKCCLNFELDSYMDALKGFPSTDTKLYTQKGKAVHFKSDIFKGLMWFSYLDDKNKIVALTVDRVHEIVALNKNDERPEELEDFADLITEMDVEPDFENVVGQDSLTRFDNKLKRNKRGRGKRKPQQRTKSRNKGNSGEGKPQRQNPSAEKQSKGGGDKPAQRPKRNQKPRNKQGKGNNANAQAKQSKPKGNAPKAQNAEGKGAGNKRKRPNRNNRPKGQKPNNNTPKPE